MDGEVWLPVEVIQCIQSCLRGKEAARTTILSKSWYAAWSTGPTVVLDCRSFSNSKRPFGEFAKRTLHGKRKKALHGKQSFEEFAKKTLQRYQDSSLMIQSFKLGSSSHHPSDIICYNNLIADAMKMGATDLQLELPRSFALRKEVLGSESLLKLSACNCEIDGKYLSFSRLKSLNLENVRIRGDTISCCGSLEELTLSNCHGSEQHQVNLYELHKLRRLFLDSMNVDPMFSTEFASRFPCLKDFTLLNYPGYEEISIATTSLETITFKSRSYKGGAKFDVPNIKKFTYLGSCLPNLSIKSASREWDFDVSISSKRLHETSWFLNLKKLLMKFRLSRISLSIKLENRVRLKDSEHEVDNIEAVAEPLKVEKLMIVAPPTFRYALMLRLFVAINPKFMTLLRLSEQRDAYFDTLCKSLMHQVYTLNCGMNLGIPDQDIFGHLGLKQALMEKDYEKYEDGRIRGTKTRFQFVWRHF